MIEALYWRMLDAKELLYEENQQVYWWLIHISVIGAWRNINLSYRCELREIAIIQWMRITRYADVS